MGLRTALIISGLVLVCGCGGSTPAANQTTPVQGVDFSGTYQFKDIECFNGAGTETASATIPGFTDSAVIIGNALTGTTAQGICTVALAETIMFSSSANSTGLLISGISVQSATGGSCSITKTLSGSVITPTTSSTTYSVGESFGNISADYLWAAPYLALPSGYSDGSGSDICYSVFMRQ
jgi:hypothetical protein